MRPKISKFKVNEKAIKDKMWANYADENVLLNTHPHVKATVDLTDPVMDYISTAKPSLMGEEGGRTPMTMWLKKRGAVREIDSDYITWKLKAAGKVKTISGGNYQPEDITPGKNRQPFIFLSDTDNYVTGDIIAPEVAKEFNFLIETSFPEVYGDFYAYTGRVVDTNDNAYFPPELLESGLKWCKIDSAYGESSKDYGSVRFQGMSWIEFETSMHDSGKEVKVTNKAHGLSHIKVESYGEVQGVEKKTFKDQIIHTMEAQMLNEAYYEREKRCYYGRSGGRNYIDSSSQYHRRIAPGFLEFMEDGNVIPYPIYGGSIDMLINNAQRVWFDRVKYSNRTIVFGTGEGGLKQANDWITNKFQGTNIPSDFNTFVDKGGTTYGEGYSGLVAQTAYFTEIQYFPFGRIRFEHWPILDSTELNGSLLHPETGIPLSSYEYIALDQGTGDAGGNNIEMLKRRDAEVFAYECGTWSPIGPINRANSRFVSSGRERAYWLRWADTYGMRVKDITLGIWFKPAVTY